MGARSAPPYNYVAEAAAEAAEAAEEAEAAASKSVLAIHSA